MATTPVQTDLDFEKASKLLNVMLDPRSSDDGSPVAGQVWFNTTSNRVKGYDGTTVFSLLRLDGTDTYTGILTFNPSSGSVPFAVDATKNGAVTNLNSDRVDGYHAAEAATASTLAARDSSGNVTVATPTSDGHAATKAYVDSIAAGQDWKDSCVVATTENITLSGEQTIDGVAVTAGQRVLVKDQSTGSENGLYVCSASSWSRTTDSDENAEVTTGLTTFIESGTENAGSGYTLTTTGGIVVGTTALTFTRTSGGSVYSDGNGMVKSGTTFHFAQSASYTTGGIPYASGSTTIGFISAVDSGKVLKSNGTGTVPLWASLDLTADVGASVLPVANGGTGTATQFTQGSVVFAGASGVYAQDNAGLFFDPDTDRLGINTATPGATLDVAGNILLSSGAARSITGPTGDDLKVIAGPDHALEGIKWYVDGGTTPGMVLLKSDNATGKVGIGGGIVPDELLHLYTNVAEDIKLRMNSDSTGSAYLEIDRQTTAGKVGIILQDSNVTKWTLGDLNGNNSFVFDSASVSDALVILQDGNVGIGTTSPNEQLEITGNFRLPATTATTGIIYIDGDRFIHNFQHPTGSTAVPTGRNAFVGLSAGNLTMGSSATITSHGSFNNGFGFAVLDALTTGYNNNAFGYAALSNATTGNENNAFGATALGGLTTGIRNSAFGNNALNDVTTGNYNIGLGHMAGEKITTASYNIAVGLNSIAANLTVAGLIGIGRNALENLTAGSGYTIAIGGFAGRKTAASADLTDSDYSIYIGYDARGTEGATNEIVIGKNAEGNGSNTVTLGNDDVTDTYLKGALHVTSTTLVDNLNADMLDGYEASALLDLANSTGDTDDISEGVTNLFYTDARARAALSSTDSAEIAYNSSTGVLGLGTEAGRVKSGTIGDGTNTSLTFTHSLGTKDVITVVYQVGSPYRQVLCGIDHTSTTQVTLQFNTAPASSSLKVVCVAANG